MTCDGSDFDLFDGFTDMKDTTTVITWYRNQAEILWRHETSINGTTQEKTSSKLASKLKLINTQKQKYHKIQMLAVDWDDNGFYWCTINSYGYTVVSSRRNLQVVDKLKRQKRQWRSKTVLHYFAWF